MPSIDDILDEDARRWRAEIDAWTTPWRLPARSRRRRTLALAAASVLAAGVATAVATSGTGPGPRNNGRTAGASSTARPLANGENEAACAATPRTLSVRPATVARGDTVLVIGSRYVENGCADTGERNRRETSRPVGAVALYLVESQHGPLAARARLGVAEGHPGAHGRFAVRITVPLSTAPGRAWIVDTSGTRAALLVR